MGKPLRSRNSNYYKVCQLDSSAGVRNKEGGPEPTLLIAGGRETLPGIGVQRDEGCF